jgi:hypothetical protein
MNKSPDWTMTNGEFRFFFEKILAGCKNVKKDSGCHKDAKILATLIIKDCNAAIKKAQEK